jgi:cytochrome oxidase Cu insertion factor (SCO1/SenC/PrrC family)
MLDSTQVNARRRRTVAAMTCVAAMAGLLVLAGLAMATGQVGEPAADFTLIDTQGTSHTLSNCQGQVVILFMVGYG